MNDFIDIYCERLGPGFWAEPLNAITNLSFFLAAFFAWRLQKKYSPENKSPLILVALLACIGTGSFLFHTLATNWAQLADILPILFYQIAFIVLYSRSVMQWPAKKSAIILILFFLAVYGFGQIPDIVLNGSLSYAPALLFLTGFAFWHWKRVSRERYLLLMASGLFLVSLTFRSLDMQFCGEIPIGLHFLWHILNGILLYGTARAYILNCRS